MALRVRGFVRIGAAMAGCVLVAACTPEPAPTVTPAPTPVSSTPTETDIERQQRLDYEAAEKAYVAQHGGAGSTGSARHSQEDRRSRLNCGRRVSVICSYVTTRDSRRTVARKWRNGDCRYRQSRVVSPSSLRLVSCEDNSKIKFTDRRGRDVTPTDAVRTYVQQLTAGKRDGQWVITDVEIASQSTRSTVPYAHHNRRGCRSDSRSGTHGADKSCRCRGAQALHKDRLVLRNRNQKAGSRKVRSVKDA